MLRRQFYSRAVFLINAVIGAALALPAAAYLLLPGKRNWDALALAHKIDQATRAAVKQRALSIVVRSKTRVDHRRQPQQKIAKGAADLRDDENRSPAEAVPSKAAPR